MWGQLQIDDAALPFTLLFLVLSLVVGIVGYIYVFEHQQEIAKPGSIFVPFRYQVYIWLHVVAIQFCQHSFWEHRLGLAVVIATLMSLFYPYLRKSSPYLSYSVNGVCIRCWDEKLITTSYLYLLGTVSNLFFGYYQFAYLCVLTSMGSVLYHRHREGKFFNLDNIFATSHVFLFGYTWYHAWHADLTYFLLGSASLPVAIFLLVYCGDPADIMSSSGVLLTSETLSSIQSSSKTPIQRHSRGIYDQWHTYWHVVSALGPVLVSYYLHKHGLVDTMSASNSQAEMTMITGALAASVTLNILANVTGAVPFN
jgi:hypothetical protein|eukprot:gene12824-9169_t